MKKYLAFVPFLLLVLVVMSSGCTDNTTNSTVSNSTFNESGVSFTYPGNWTQMTLEETKNYTASPSSAVGGIKSDDGSAVIVVSKNPATSSTGTDSLSALKSSMETTLASNNISEISTVSINGKEALVATYTTANNKVKVVVFLVGDNYYMIEMMVLTEDYSSFEAVLNSIQESIQV